MQEVRDLHLGLEPALQASLAAQVPTGECCSPAAHMQCARAGDLFFTRQSTLRKWGAQCLCVHAVLDFVTRRQPLQLPGDPDGSQTQQVCLQVLTPPWQQPHPTASVRKC